MLLGGKGAGSGTAAEDAALTAFRIELEGVIEKTGESEIDMIVLLKVDSTNALPLVIFFFQGLVQNNIVQHHLHQRDMGLYGPALSQLLTYQLNLLPKYRSSLIVMIYNRTIIPCYILLPINLKKINSLFRLILEKLSIVKFTFQINTRRMKSKVKI